MTDTAKNLDKPEFGVLTGVAYYASVHKPAMPRKDDPYDSKPMFTVKLVPDAESAAIIKGYKHSLKDPGEKSSIPAPYLEIKNKIYAEPSDKAAWEAEVLKKKPQVVDSKRKDIPEDILIGNGSKVRVKVAWTYVKQQKKRFPRLYGLQVLDLVEYKKRDDVFVDELDGFSVDDDNNFGDKDNDI